MLDVYVEQQTSDAVCHVAFRELLSAPWLRALDLCQAAHALPVLRHHALVGQVRIVLEAPIVPGEVRRAGVAAQCERNRTEAGSGTGLCRLLRPLLAPASVSDHLLGRDGLRSLGTAVGLCAGAPRGTGTHTGSKD